MGSSVAERPNPDQTSFAVIIFGVAARLRWQQRRSGGFGLVLGQNQTMSSRGAESFADIEHLQIPPAAQRLPVFFPDQQIKGRLQIVLSGYELGHVSPGIKNRAEVEAAVEKQRQPWV